MNSGPHLGKDFGLLADLGLKDIFLRNARLPAGPQESLIAGSRGIDHTPIGQIGQLSVLLSQQIFTCQIAAL